MPKIAHWTCFNTQGTYGIVAAISAEVLCEMVGQFIAQGWSPCGGIHAPEVWLEAMPETYKHKNNLEHPWVQAMMRLPKAAA